MNFKKKNINLLQPSLFLFFFEIIGVSCFDFVVDEIIFVKEKMPYAEIMSPNNLAIAVFDCDGGTALHCRESNGCFRIQRLDGG